LLARHDVATAKGEDGARRRDLNEELVGVCAGSQSKEDAIKQLFFVTGIVCALGAMGCGATPAAETDSGSELGTATTPLLSISLDGGRVVEFYEVPSSIAVAEHADVGVSSALQDRALTHSSPDQTFRALQPGKPVPAVLTDAMARIKDGQVLVCGLGRAEPRQAIPERDRRLR
jgi:hypothetical protein